MLHYSIIIKGKVQGVSYRQHTKNKAQDLKIKGFIKNMIDGSVYMEIEGDEKNIQELVDWCHIGSPLSRVVSVELERGKLKGFDNFQIKQ